VRCCTSFAACFGTLIKTVVVIDNDDPPPFYPSWNQTSHKSGEHYIADVKNHVLNQRVFFFFWVTSA
jgi:hypothetical protein